MIAKYGVWYYLRYCFQLKKKYEKLTLISDYDDLSTKKFDPGPKGIAFS